MNRVDMHVHTNLSNGSESLEFVLENAQKNGVRVLSITDFDNLQSYYNMQNMDVSKYYEGDIVVGVEVNCKFQGFCSDMLAYNVKDLDTLQKWLNVNTGKDKTLDAQMEQLEYYKKVARSIKAKFDEDITITPSQFFAGKVIAANLAKYEENVSIIKGIEKPVNFFVEHVLNHDSPFYFDLSIYKPSLKDFIDVVHSCGGKVFVAHPFAYAHSEEKLYNYLKICKNEGVEGIECFQSYNENVAYATELPLKFCRENGLFISGGTDFHKQGGDERIGGVGILGTENCKNYSPYIPLEYVEAWIEPVDIRNLSGRKL